MITMVLVPLLLLSWMSWVTGGADGCADTWGDAQIEDMTIPDSVPGGAFNAQQAAQKFMQRMGGQVDPSMTHTIASVFAGMASALAAAQPQPAGNAPAAAGAKGFGFGFGGPSTSAIPAAAAATVVPQAVNVLQVREKRKAEDPSATAASAAAQQSPEKKVKVESASSEPSTS